ncbi:YbjN domain-containing protein [Parahaliea aestuarii]|uniref:YbjN domain-containing protein n=1 Tax=Parahaliea aestuarii TaxID=1852021 RepID=A0A5C9A4P9_9GAMM|nr:YbjN domain-containing protein [Parahaliea aestuarii]TXS94700.1 YbjN domain-containing protein [Parahaliea aestuarii]
MSSLYKPDRALLERWMEETKVAFDLCGECEGLHVRALQALDGVVDSRIILEHYGLVFSTGLEVRPMALLPLAADLGRINMDYPYLKVFLDIIDDATPQLVIAGFLPVHSGITRDQFAAFVVMVMEGTRQLAEECLRLDYLFPEGDPQRGGPSRALH